MLWWKQKKLNGRQKICRRFTVASGKSARFERKGRGKRSEGLYQLADHHRSDSKIEDLGPANEKTGRVKEAKAVGPGSGQNRITR